MRNCSQPLVPEQPHEADDQARDPTLALFADLSICNATKLALSLCPLFLHGSEERATMRIFIHFVPQLLHAAGLRHQDVEYVCAIIVQGKWRQLWDMAMARAEKLESKQAKNPKIARSRSSQGEIATRPQVRHGGQSLQGLQDCV